GKVRPELEFGSFAAVVMISTTDLLIILLNRPVLVKRFSEFSWNILMRLSWQLTELTLWTLAFYFREDLIDTGGCDIQKQEIREALELPLTHHELYQEIGINPPRPCGVLLHGQPGTGTGKALLA
ncbi:UNVERIFIED_CONTAM: 26S proteasome regulatory subunitB, partial [Sesamum radiatum]